MNGVETGGCSGSFWHSLMVQHQTLSFFPGKSSKSHTYLDPTGDAGYTKYRSFGERFLNILAVHDEVFQIREKSPVNDVDGHTHGANTKLEISWVQGNNTVPHRFFLKPCTISQSWVGNLTLLSELPGKEHVHPLATTIYCRLDDLIYISPIKSIPIQTFRATTQHNSDWGRILSHTLSEVTNSQVCIMFVCWLVVWFVWCLFVFCLFHVCLSLVQNCQHMSLDVCICRLLVW